MTTIAKRTLYLDHMATTPCLPEVVQAILPYFTERFANPQSFHPPGREVQEAMENARQKVADLIGAKSKEIYFTSGATEASNWAIKGAAQALSEKKGKHIVTSQIEHYATMQPCKSFEKRGFEVTYLPVDKYGFVHPDEVARAIRPDTILVTLTHASNEIGTIEPIAEIAKLTRERNVYLHVDGACTVGYIPINVAEMGIDMLSMGAHLCYGPKGVGALYIRRGAKILPLLEGGTQEEGRRAGTESAPLIVGMGKVFELAKRDMENRRAHLIPLRDRLLQGIPDRIERVFVTGHPTIRLPHHASVVVEFVEGEGILLSLILQSGIFGSSGSACTSKALQHSHVLEAIGVDLNAISGSLVFGVGLNNTLEDMDYLLQELPPVVKKLRAMSPLSTKDPTGMKLNP